MYKIYQQLMQNGTANGGRLCVGKASTPQKCVERISSLIEIHNDGVMLENPEKEYLYVRGDMVEQITRGTVRAYVYDDYPSWFNMRKSGDNKIVCDIGFMYVYMRKYITLSIHLEDNVEVVNLPSTQQIIFYWEEV